jgi:dimethylhistidine N-methyltransferase
MTTNSSWSNAQFAFLDLKPDLDVIVGEVQQSLSLEAKSISPKFFYDERGSELFDAITELPEYYVTRTEMALFDAHMEEISDSLEENICVIEYGSGSTKKIRRLLDVLKPEAYVPVDISGDYLLSNAQTLLGDFPALKIFPVCADITESFALPTQVSELRPLGFYPGSSIGNFEPAKAVDFLKRVHATLGTGGYFLVGVDAKKDVSILEAAYDDAAGVTAQFNLNTLVHLNEKLGADFDLDQFVHFSKYNSDQGCIQMFLKSSVAQQVNVAGKVISFAEGELLHTENSYKYAKQEFITLAQSAQFECLKSWQDDNEWFSLFLLRAC